MKTAKKLLCLMIVLVMALGMVPLVSAGPADMNVDDYTDFDSIEYKEAVDVLTALGVLQGDGDTGARAFRPGDTITRAEASKIISYILIGKIAADALVPTATGFRDVPSSHWASPFIAYCVDRGVINGYGTGLFGPSDPVTAIQMAKMLLGAVGYGTQGEYVGPGWELRVLDRAMARGIEVLSRTGNVDYSAAATREQVAQYTFNALTIPRMVTWNTFINDYSSWSNVFQQDVARPRLGMNTFGLQRGANEKDPYGFNMYRWRQNTRYITESYPGDILLGEFTAVGANNRGWMNSNYDWQDGTDQFIEVWVNGFQVGNDGAAVTNATRFTYRDFAERGSTASPLAALFPNMRALTGYYIQLVDTFFDEDIGFDGKVDKVIISYEFLAKVSSVNTTTGLVTANVFYVGSNPDGTRQSFLVDNPTDFARDDYILVTPGITTSFGNEDWTAVPLNVVQATTQTARAERYTNTSATSMATITVGGRAYQMSATLRPKQDTTSNHNMDNGLTSGMFAGEVQFWFDSHENIIGYAAPIASSADLDYLYVIDAQFTPRAGFAPLANNVRVALANGTQQTLKFPMNATSTNVHVYNWNGTRIDLGTITAGTTLGVPNNNLQGKWFSYTMIDDETVRLTAIRNPNANAYYSLGAGITNYPTGTNDPRDAVFAATGGQQLQITSATSTNNSFVTDITGLTGAGAAPNRLMSSSTVLSVNGSRTTGHVNFRIGDFIRAASSESAFTVGLQILVVCGSDARTAIIYVIDGTAKDIKFGIITNASYNTSEGWYYDVQMDNSGETEPIYQPLHTSALARGTIVEVETAANGTITLNPINSTAGDYIFAESVAAGTVDATYINGNTYLTGSPGALFYDMTFNPGIIGERPNQGDVVNYVIHTSIGPGPSARVVAVVIRNPAAVNAATVTSLLGAAPVAGDAVTDATLTIVGSFTVTSSSWAGDIDGTNFDVAPGTATFTITLEAASGTTFTGTASSIFTAYGVTPTLTTLNNGATAILTYTFSWIT